MGIIYAIFVLGITAIASQILLLREFFASFYGNELSIGFALGVWLLAGSVSSGLAGRFFAEKIKEKEALFSFLTVLFAASVPLGIIAARMARLGFCAEAGEIPGIGALIAGAFIVFTPIALFAGFLFVLGSQIFTPSEPAKKIGYAYAVEGSGAVLGGLLASFFFIKHTPSLQAAFFLSILNLISSVLVARACKRVFLKRVLFLSALTLAALAVVSGLGGSWGRLEKKSREAYWKGFEVLSVRDSIYGKAAVTEKAGQVNFFQNGIFLFSSSDPLTAEETVHFPMVFADFPGDVLLIGGGSEVLREILKYPVERVDYIELDPLIIKLSRRFLKGKDFYSLEDKRVSVINTDGRFFVKNAKKRYEAIIINLPNPYTAQINRFYTKEFFEELKPLLSENGVAGFSVSSSANYISREQALFLESLLRTARSVYPDVKIVPGDTAHFLLSKDEGRIKLKSRFISARLKEEKIATLYVRDYYLDSLLSAERQEYLKKALSGVRGTARLNRDFIPVSYFYDMVLWSSYLSFNLSKFFLALTAPRLLAASLCGIVLLFAVFLLLRKKNGFARSVTLLALGTTGTSEIAFEIIILLSFQVLYGYLYYKIGIIITSFMFGLALGGAYITRGLNAIKNPYRLYIKIQWFVVAYPIFLLLCIQAFRLLKSEPLYSIGGNIFAVLPLAAGFIGGVQFPLANKIYMASGGATTGRSVSATYSADLFGSFVGALTVSALMVPVLGIPATCLLLALLNAASLALLYLARK